MDLEVYMHKGKYELDKPKNYYDFSYDPDHFQLWGFKEIERNNNILVTAHTGSGKTALALYAIAKTLQEGKQVIYTSPIKTLSNQKFKEFSEDFNDVGILTGDVKINPTGELLIMTAEILRNSLLRKVDDSVYEWNFNPDKVGCVILDEVHFINNKERGKVWEEIIINLKPDIQLVMLSATISGAENMSKWISQLKGKPCYLISTEKRHVPLKHSLYWDGKLHTILDDEKWINNNWLLVKKDISKRAKSKSYKTNTHYLNSCIKMMKDKNMLPANVFLLNRKMVEKVAEMLPFTFLEGLEVSEVNEIWDYHLLKYKDIYGNTKQWFQVKDLVQKGIGIHHSGIIPILKEIVEILYSKKLVKVLIATETFAMGVNMPTKTTVFTNLEKYDGHEKRLLKPEEYSQMAGRAGRRGMDIFGNVIIIPNKYLISETEAKMIMLAKPQKIKSKMQIDYNFILKRLALRIDSECLDVNVLDFLHDEIKKSMFLQEKNCTKKYIQKELEEINNKLKSVKFTGIDEFADKYELLYNSEKILSEGYNSIFRISNKDIKKHRKIIQRIKKLIPDDKVELLKEYHSIKKDFIGKEKEVEIYEGSSKYQLEYLLDYLKYNNLVDEEYNLTKLGRIVAEVNECNPLVLGEIISNKYLDELTFPEIVAFLSIFIADHSIKEPYLSDLDVSKEFSDMLYNVSDIVDKFTNEEIKLNQNIPYNVWSDWNLHLSMFNAIIRWANGKEWSEVCKHYDTFEGNFVRNVLRLVNLMRNVESIAKLTNNFKLLDKIDGYQEKLIRGVVIIDSLYI
jgi:superfamily II RNA helicase